MKKLTLEEIKEIELATLKQLCQLCEEQGLRCFLVGGTLLGAVRHGGFIPWDDDIDVGMPRDDYERFIDYCLTHEVPFQVLCNRSNPKYGYLFAKVMNKETILQELVGNRYSIEMGVNIDVFPIDGLGNTYDEAISVMNKTRFFRELLVAANWRKYCRSKSKINGRNSKAWFYWFFVLRTY